MRARKLIIPSLVFIAVVASAATRLPNETEAEVRAALEHYLLGHATGDGVW